MDEILLKAPNVVLTYAVHDRQGTCFGYFPEIEKGEYGYLLTVGQKLTGIRYRGSNYDYFVCPEILEISPKGLLIANFLNKGPDPVLCPWIKPLANAGKIEPRQMYIEPCGHLYEKNPLAKILSGDIEDCTYDRAGKIIAKGIWSQRGGGRTKVGRDDNLKNFVKIDQDKEQLSLF